MNTGGGSSTTKGGGSASFQQATDRIINSGGTFNTDGNGTSNPGNPGGEGNGSGTTLPKATTLSPTGSAATYAKTITPSDLAAHLSFIASEELEGRETAQRGQKVAARYLASQFQRMGLQPGNKGKWYQTFELNRVELRDVTIAFDGKTRLQKGKDFIYFDKFAIAQNLNAPLTFAGFGISDNRYDNLTDLDLRGKAVVVLSGEPMRDTTYILSGKSSPSDWSRNMELKRDALEKAGAKAIIAVLPDDIFTDISNRPGMTHMMEGYSLNLAYQNEGGIPLVMVPERALATTFKKGGHTFSGLRKILNGGQKVPEVKFKKVNLDIKADATREKVISENVLAYLEGTDKKDEVIVLTAHYDHLGVRDGKVYYGADDDGTGTVAILEIAEAFAEAARNGHRPRRSILFMPVSGEEKGLLGSEYYSDHPVFPLENTVCNLNIDMIGRTDKEHDKDSNYVYIIGSDKLSYDLHRANEFANQNLTQIKLDYTYNAPNDPNRFYYRSDHYNFAKHNIPVIFYFTGVHADYHKPTDTIDKIMFGKTAIIARLVFGTAWDVANREKRLVVDRTNDFKN